MMFFRSIYLSAATHAKTLYNSPNPRQYAVNYAKVTLCLTLVGGAAGGFIGLFLGLGEYFHNVIDGDLQDASSSKKIKALGSILPKSVGTSAYEGAVLGSVPITYPVLTSYDFLINKYNNLRNNHSEETNATGSSSDSASRPGL